MPFPKQIRLSHYALELLHSCEREFQLTRLLKGAPEKEEDNEHFVFGAAFGNAIAKYLETQDIERAIFTLLLSYKPWVETDKKSFWKACYAILRNQDVLDDFLNKWEVMQFDGKPAIELGIRTQINDQFYHAGFMDVVVKNRAEGYYAVVDVKTTSSNLNDINPLYKNSGQVLGYSIILDRIVGEDLASYSVLYMALQYPGNTGAVPKLHILEYKKTLLDRLQWFLTLKMDVEHIESMLHLNHFPKRGDSCLRYNRPCPFFNICHMHSQDVYKEEEKDPHEEDYTFRYNLDDLIAEHLERVTKETQNV